MSTETQQWGISADVPEGYDVALKNGFFPMTGVGWRVGSTGYVADPDGGGYAMTILTDRMLTQAEGIALVERDCVARQQTPRVRSVRRSSLGRVECITNPASGGSWTSLTQSLGLPASRADDVRRAAGGGGPFRGQSICTP